MNESNNHLKNPFAVPFNPLRLGVLLVFREVEGDENYYYKSKPIYGRSMSRTKRTERPQLRNTVIAPRSLWSKLKALAHLTLFSEV